MKTILVRGAGDLASGIIYKLVESGFKVIALETEKPTAIRRKVSFSEAVFTGEMEVEGMIAKLSTIEEAIKEDGLHVVIDPELKILKSLKPFAIVDAILAKKNLGTKSSFADIIIGVGPGFTAGVDCHAVVETKRGHDLGRIYYTGSAIANTGVPGEVGGESTRRVIHSKTSGNLKGYAQIGEIVKSGDLVFEVNGEKHTAPFTGIVRGIIRDGYVNRGLKVADIDPRLEQVNNCTTISDKARTIAGGVLEAVVKLGSVINE